jgi:type I restriction enzyme R subunit
MLAGQEELRAHLADACERAEIIQQLAEGGIDFQQVALQAGKPDADPFDLLCHLEFNAPILTRRQRANRMKKDKAPFFARFAPEARGILNILLEKYAADGELQFILPAHAGGITGHEFLAFINQEQSTLSNGKKGPGLFR